MNSLVRCVILAMAALAMMLSGCVDGGAFGEFHNRGPEGWAYGDTALFTIARTDSLAPAELRVAVRNNNSYPYSNLWLEVTATLPDGKTALRDTVNLPLADPYGRWTGRGFGAGYQTEVAVNPQVVLPNGTRVSVRHIMRVDTVTGIEQVGVTLSPLKN